MSDVTVYYPDGTQGDLASLQQRYGAGIRILRSQHAHAYRLRKIVVRADGITNLWAWVFDKTGRPVPAQPVTYTFPNLNEPDRTLPRIPEDTTDAWAVRGVQNKNRTDGAGMVSFQIGDQSWIRDGRGPYSLFVLSPSIGSDCFDGIGWQMGTDHYGPVEMYFYEEDAPLPPEPGEDDDTPPAPVASADLLAAVNRVAGALERLATHLGA